MRLLVVLLSMGLLAGPAGAAPEGKDPGTLRTYPYTSAATTDDTYALGAYSYAVYTPRSLPKDRPVPLVVMVHGCNTTAEQQAGANRFHPIAEREHFVVLYPDVPANRPTRCWKFFDPQSQQRDSGDVLVIADMTRRVMQNWRIDPQRVYVIGMSSGAMITSDLVASYPELYAAAGLMAGCAYRAVACAFQDAGHVVEPVALEAQLAQQQMGTRARLVPWLVLHGDADGTVPKASGDNAFEQWRQTDDLIAPGAIGTAPARTRTGQVKGGHSYAVEQWTDPQGCLAMEKWVVHGMDHFWSGGSADPAWYQWEDPKGPSAAEAAWAFFSRYRLGSTSLPCMEAR